MKKKTIKDKITVVRISQALLDEIELFMDRNRDMYGVPIFRSKLDVVNQAVREFLGENIDKKMK